MTYFILNNGRFHFASELYAQKKCINFNIIQRILFHKKLSRKPLTAVH